MEKNYQYLGNSATASTEGVSKTCEVPKSLLRIMVKFGPLTALAIGINHLRFRVMCRVLYKIDLLKTLQMNYYRLRASKVALWMIRKSVDWLWLNRLICRIERHFRKDYSVNFSKSRNSDISRMFNSLKKQFQK